MLTDHTKEDLKEWFANYPKAKEVWDKSMNYGNVLWEYKPGKRTRLPFPFPDQVQVKKLDLDSEYNLWSTCKKDSDNSVYGMVLNKHRNHIRLWLAEGSHEEKLGIQFLLYQDG